MKRRLGQPGHEPSEQPAARAARLQKRSNETLDRSFGQSPRALPAQVPREPQTEAGRLLLAELAEMKTASREEFPGQRPGYWRAFSPGLEAAERLLPAIEAEARESAAGARAAGDAGLREAAIATLRDYHLVAFDSGHDHPIEECHLPLFRERLALFAAPRDAGAGLADPIVCPACHGRRWADDENWQPDYPESWKGERYPGDGLIPCGFCNFAGWDVPVAAALQTPGAPGSGDGE